MSIKLSKIYIRPNASTPWHYEVLDSSLFLEQFFNVHSTNCIMNEKFEIDNLHMKFVSEWTSNEACQAYLEDPILIDYWKTRDEYNLIVGIVAQDRVTEHTD